LPPNPCEARQRLAEGLPQLPGPSPEQRHSLNLPNISTSKHERSIHRAEAMDRTGDLGAGAKQGVAHLPSRGEGSGWKLFGNDLRRRTPFATRNYDRGSHIGPITDNRFHKRRRRKRSAPA